MESVQGIVTTGHQDVIHDAQMDYYGTRLATCSSDSTIKVFDIKDSGTQIHVADLKGHDGPVWQVAWAHPRYGTILASCGHDGKIIVWQEASHGYWIILQQFTLHEASANSISWAPPSLGLILAAGSSDGTVSVITYTGLENQLWDYFKMAGHTGCNAVSWCPNATPASKRFVSGGCDNLVKVWKYDDSSLSWTEEAVLEAHSDWVRDVAWAPSWGPRRHLIASCSQDNRVLLWKQESDASATWTSYELNTFEDAVWRLSWSLTGQMLAVSSGESRLSLWQERAGQWVNVSAGSQPQKSSSFLKCIG